MILIIRTKLKTIHIPAAQVAAVEVDDDGFVVRTQSESYAANEVVWQETIPAHNLMGVLAYFCYEGDGVTEVSIDRATVQGIVIESEPVLRNAYPGEVKEFVIPRGFDQTVLGILDVSTGSLFDTELHERAYPDDSIVKWLEQRVESEMDLEGKPWRWSPSALEIIEGFSVETGGKSRTA